MKYYIILITLLSSNAFSQNKIAIQKEFVFKKNLTIGNEVNGINNLLGLPYAVVTDSLNRIYISDNKLGTIKVFDLNGEFLFNIGKTGRGPGEFLKITSFAIIPEGLIVFDFFQRRFTKFNLIGEVLETSLLSRDVYMNPDYLLYMGNGKILSFNRSLEGTRNQVSPDKDFLMHEISLESYKTLDSFLPITHTIDTNKNFERYFEGKFSKGFFSYKDNKLTLAPFFYRGKILQYTKKDGTWNLSNKFTGFRETEHAYIEYENPREVIGKGMASNPDAFGPLAGIMKNESLGIFQKKNGDYLHLGLLEIGKEQKLYVNLFEESGKLKAHGPVTNLKPGLQKNDFYRRMRFYWMDEKDQLYIIDGAENGFFVYRGTIEMKE